MTSIPAPKEYTKIRSIQDWVSSKCHFKNGFCVLVCLFVLFLLFTFRRIFSQQDLVAFSCVDSLYSIFCWFLWYFTSGPFYKSVSVQWKRATSKYRIYFAYRKNNNFIRKHPNTFCMCHPSIFFLQHKHVFQETYDLLYNMCLLINPVDT